MRHARPSLAGLLGPAMVRAAPSFCPAVCLHHHLLDPSCPIPIVPATSLQDEAVRLGPPRRGGERGAAEKKIAILEKALSLHPGSDELLLALLKAVRGSLPWPLSAVVGAAACMHAWALPCCLLPRCTST